MRIILFTLTGLLLIGTHTMAQQIPIPQNCTIVDSVKGDLDGDSIKELAVVYNNGSKVEDGVPRSLIIYKNRKGWQIWKQSSQALLGSRDGGMMGDPYEGIEIKNGCLLIYQGGGSSWKWSLVDKYRFQNQEFYLIGYTSTYGKPCEHWTHVDFNLSTGKIVIQKQYERCDKGEQQVYKSQNETFFRKGIKLTLQHRNQKKIVFTSPKYHQEILIALPLDQ